MNVVAWIVGVVVAAGFGAVGAAKIADMDRTRERLGYQRNQYRLIGVSEVAAAVAIIVGLISTSLEWIAIAAAVGLVILMMGALMAHARVSDGVRNIAPAIVMMLLSGLFIIFIAIR